MSSRPSITELLTTPQGMVVALLVVLLAVYSVVVAGQLLVVVWAVVPLTSLYLLYRVVLALERAVAAYEARVDAETGTTLSPPRASETLGVTAPRSPDRGEDRSDVASDESVE